MNNYFNLQDGEEQKEKVLANVQNSIVFSGSNVWVLACAIVIASVGLNLNSTAVVIGAMLISPLMGPIVGAGFALAMFDFKLLRKSLKNLLVSTLVGLLFSSLYFFLTPFKEAQSEILARTAPNIYDVIIAFFGGLVGVIAVTRVEKGNPIPGVAIATALMPPLCTAGYGLATGNFSFFGGALFLYAINCVFICIATYLIAKYLKYPAVGFVDAAREKKVRNWITFITVSMIVPSIFFAYKFIQEQRFKEKVSEYVQKEFERKNNTIVYQKTTYSATGQRTIELAFLNRKFTAKEIADENKKLEALGLPNTRLIIRQDSAFLAEASTKKIANNEIENDFSNVIAELNASVDRYSFKTDNLFNETKAIFPELSTISVAKQEIFLKKDSTQIIPVALYQSENDLSDERKTLLADWLKTKLKVDTLEIYRRP
ncbi:membrane protein [Kaistella solincola]|uniref:Uncharacterized hydrophobic domain-containing protein n=2 Tax=Kaistella TaxID=2782231 RepID=A0A1I3NGR0_9FLAO|nr:MULTISPECIES: DUF389 domain-containing protein [Kaistella]KIA82834.1 membrane protein [Kaistella solincola]SFJ08355.1 uncharacterized hydrophobic domain-containing protein [Kaistella treverensis]